MTHLAFPADLHASGSGWGNLVADGKRDEADRTDNRREAAPAGSLKSRSTRTT